MYNQECEPQYIFAIYTFDKTKGKKRKKEGVFNHKWNLEKVLTSMLTARVYLCKNFF